MYAVASIKGFQFKLSEGEKYQIPKIPNKEGAKIKFEDVLLIKDKNGEVLIGDPFINGAMIEAEVLTHGRGNKIKVVKYKRRKRYLKTQGHRQDFSEIQINKIKASVETKKETITKESPDT